MDYYKLKLYLLVPLLFRCLFQ